MTITVNGELRQVPDELTIGGLLDLLGAPRTAIAVEVDHEIIPRATHATSLLHDGAEVEIVTFVGGG